MNRTHVRPARLADLPGVAAVLQDAFSEKMRAIFGNQPKKVRALLETLYTGPVQRGYDGVLVAERGGRIIGTLLIEPMYFTTRENRAFEYLAIRDLGVLRTVRASFLLWRLSHHPEPGEAYISDLGVAQDCRGEGVGQFLLDQAEQWALDHDRTHLTLWVAATNDSAIGLYDKMGFEAVRARSSRITRLFFGIRDWHFMEKRLVTDETY